MAFRKSTGLVNAMASAFGALFASGTLQIRTGAQPATANDAAAGSLLATINLPSSPFGSPASGVVSKANTWSAVATGTGVAAHARFISSDGLKTFDCSIAESGADLDIDDEDVVLGGNVVVSAFTYTVPLS
jgi:hypothetical protein